MTLTSRPPLTVAHRGDALGAMENTVAAIVRAAEIGADAVEVDVQTTVDDVVVLHHDAVLHRLWNHPGVIGEMTLSEIRRCAPAVPTLAEALQALGDRAVPLVLDVATPRDAMAAHEDAAQARSTAPVWFCGDPTALAAVRARNEHIPLLLTWDTADAPGTALLQATRPTYFNPHHSLLDADSVAYWHDRGVKVSTWTVDDGARHTQLIGWGVDAIISNDVSALVAAVGADPRRSALRLQPTRGRSSTAHAQAARSWQPLRS